MGRIETQRPGIRTNPGPDYHHEYLGLEQNVYRRFQELAVRDGFGYINAVFGVFLSLYANGKMSIKLISKFPKLAKEMGVDKRSKYKKNDKRIGPQIVKRHIKLKKHIYDTALARWRQEVPDSPSGWAMLRFFARSYVSGRLDLCLKKGLLKPKKTTMDQELSTVDEDASSTHSNVVCPVCSTPVLALESQDVSKSCPDCSPKTERGIKFRDKIFICSECSSSFFKTSERYVTCESCERKST